MPYILYIMRYRVIDISLQCSSSPIFHLFRSSQCTWQVLFPDKNVEFAVTALYQVGSIVTVAALSFTENFVWGF